MSYYAEKLSAERLKRVYDIATPRVRQYLDAELEYVLSKIKPEDILLDLGCGYGRIIPYLAGRARFVFGIDDSIESLRYGRKNLTMIRNCSLACMDAALLGLADHALNAVICIQNGISAFHVDQTHLIKEAVRVTKPGGIVLFSSYSEKFWPHRLAWFELQAREGLLGEIDYDWTGNGIIVCRDGFQATTVDADRFLELTEGLDAEKEIVEIDDSSLFLEITPR